MPLRIWLPLNNSFENRGIDGASVTTGGVFETPGKLSAYCWRSSERISVPYTYGSTERLSVCMWVKPNSARAWTSVFGWGNTSTRQNRIEVNADAGTTYYFFGSNDCLVNSNLIVAENFTNAVWHHFAMVADGTNVRFYLDGALSKTSPQRSQVSATFDGTNTFYFGGYNDTFNGYYNDVRVYDHALSQKEVTELAKGMMLHIPMYAGYPGIGTNIAKSTSATPVAYSIGQHYTRMQYDTNFYGLKEGDTFTFCFKVTAPADRGIYARVQYYTDIDHRTSVTNSNTIPAGTTGYTYLTSTISASQRGYTQMELLINNPDNSLTTSATCYVSEVKLERGSVRTPWSPDASSSQFTPDYSIKDCSGYQASVSTSGSAVVATGNGPRYNSEVVLGETSYVQYPVPSGISQCTIAFWVKWASGGGYSTVDCLKNNPAGGMWLAVNTEHSKLWACWGGTYNRVSGSLTANTWYHVALTFNAGITQWYLNGVAVGSAVDFSARGTTWPSGTRTIGNSYTGSTWNTKFSGSFSDWRFYTTVLTAAQIKELYDAPISVANTGTCLAEQFTEGATGISFAKTGVVSCNGISSLPGKYDPEVLIEPDGSCWAHIGHHADPTTYKFSSGDPFTTGVWKDDRRFLDASYCDLVDKWEFIVEQKQLADSAVQRFRWVQPVNPNTGTFENTVAANITRYGSDYGYNDSGYGGMYKINSVTYYCCNDGTKGNWWGAIGAWNTIQGGIPGWARTIVKDGGYLDLYIRIDNVTFSTARSACSLDKGGKGVLSPEFVEQ